MGCWRSGALLVAMAVLLATGCRPAPAPPLDLPIYFTGDTDGRLKPCGCFTGQFGGLTRLKTVLDGEAPAGALRVDVGDAIGGHADYDVIQYRYVLEAFAAMNYDALNLGQREAQLTAEQLRELKKISPVPLLSANLLDQKTRAPLFAAHRIVQRGAYRIGLIGVVDPRGLESKLGAGLAVGDMASAIARSVEALRGQTDLIVLLAFTDEATLSQLAGQFYECQVILGGRVSQPAQSLVKANRSLVYFVTNESRALGSLRLQLTRGAPLQVTGNEIRLLHDQIPEARAIDQLMQRYREEIRQTKLSVDDPQQLGADMVPNIRTMATYVGSDKCLACHPTAASVWLASGHARAFAPLQVRRADADPKCIGCHTVGFGEPSGYRRGLGASALVNVGCESCHGPGSWHVRAKEGEAAINFTFRPLDAGDCRKCHHGEFSRPFDWNQFWPGIKHGKEPPTAPRKI
jgi:hypothetical protein